MDSDSKDIVDACERAEELAKDADEMIPEDEKVDKDTGKKKCYVAGGAVFIPAAGSNVCPPLEMMAGSKHQKGFVPAQGGNQPSAVPCPSGGVHQYPPPTSQYKGHVESKFIEKVFTLAQSLDLFFPPGLPKGTLYFKLRGRTRAQPDGPPLPCEESCEELIKCAEGNIKVVNCDEL